MIAYVIDYFDYLRYLPYLPVFFVFMAIFWFGRVRLTKYNDMEIMSRSSNISAVSVSFAGAAAGMIIASLGSLIGSSEDMWYDWKVYSFQGLIAVIITILAQNVIDMAVLPSIENDTELEHGNMAVAFVESTAYIGIGFIMGASFSGYDPSFWNGTLSTIVFSVLGVITVLIFYKLYDFVREDVDRPIRNQSMATAMNVGGFMLGSSILLAYSITGDTMGWREDLLDYAQGAMMAGVMMVVILVSTEFVCNLMKFPRGRSSSGALMRFVMTVGLALTGGQLIIN